MDTDEINPAHRALANEIRDKLIELVDRHDKEAHDGERCINGRAGLIGWLCHSVGVHTQDDFHVEFVARVAAEIEEYDLHHAQMHGQGHVH